MLGEALISPLPKVRRPTVDRLVLVGRKLGSIVPQMSTLSAASQVVARRRADGGGCGAIDLVAAVGDEADAHDHDGDHQQVPKCRRPRPVAAATAARRGARPYARRNLSP